MLEGWNIGRLESCKVGKLTPLPSFREAREGRQAA
jgi:hypothetical protein